MVADEASDEATLPAAREEAWEQSAAALQTASLLASSHPALEMKVWTGYEVA
jgi:hypothetical protein